MFDYWADTNHHLLLLKSSVAILFRAIKQVKDRPILDPKLVQTVNNMVLA